MADLTHARRLKAIDNNIGLYRAIFEHHAVRFTVGDETAHTLDDPPPLYSNLITRMASWRPDATFDAIDRAAEEQRWGGWGGWSIKDSFDVLDLEPHGFERLFGARWFYLPAERFTPVAGPAGTYEVIGTTDQFAAWISAWGARETTRGEAIFRPGLLNDPAVHLVGRYEAEELTGGCLVNATGDVLGISNVFATRQDPVPFWSGTTAFVHAAIGRKDIVGYQRPALVAELGVLGYESVGALAIWLEQPPRR